VLSLIGYLSLEAMVASTFYCLSLGTKMRSGSWRRPEDTESLSQVGSWDTEALKQSMRSAGWRTINMEPDLILLIIEWYLDRQEV
jgi:hypothetical protein